MLRVMFMNDKPKKLYFWGLSARDICVFALLIIVSAILGFLKYYLFSTIFACALYVYSARRAFFSFAERLKKEGLKKALLHRDTLEIIFIICFGIYYIISTSKPVGPA